MKLSRVRIEALRQFRQPLEIDGLREGINLFVGPNGAGKSTIVRAIRAAFFERYGSSSVSDLLPWGDSGAAPSVEIDFTSGGQAYRLRKRFLARKRCSLEVDSRLLENAEAEGRLAELLGFQYAAKGASRPEHWGVPGLLWIQQGSGQELHGSVEHATDHLRRALDQSLGEVASTGGDDVYERVRAERDRLLTRTGQPTGELREATAACAGARDRAAALEAQLAAYREQVDRFGSMAAQVQADGRERPWRRFEAQAREVQERLAQIAKMAEALGADRQILSQTGVQVRLLEQQRAVFAEQSARLEQRRDAVAQARAALAETELALQPRAQQLDAAQSAHDQAQACLLAAEGQEQRHRLLARIAELRAHHDRLGAGRRRAREIGERLDRHRREIAARRISDEQIQALRRQERDIQTARIRLESVATGLSWRLEPGQSIGCGDARLEASGQSRLVKRTALTIPQVGTLVIEPGGEDLAELAAARERLEMAQASLLQSLGSESLAAAEQRLQQRQAAEHDAQVEQALLAELAPQGIDALGAEIAAVAGELADAEARLAQAPLEDAAPPAVDDARGAHAEAMQRLRQAQASEQAARAAWSTARNALAHAQRELAGMEAAEQDEGYRRRVAQNQSELEATQLRYGALAAKVDAAQVAIDAERPQVLRQDAERLEHSASRSREAHEQRRGELIRLQSQLDAAGAGGLEEQLAQACGDLERAQRRQRELQRRAQALDLLAGMLTAKRQALTRRLQAPLLGHLNHYLQLLMPGACVTLDEALKPIALSARAVARPAGNSPAAGQGGSGTSGGQGPFEDLSFGTREQLSLISRLAYADLLKEANRPTLIILDDSLVNTDEVRMSQMKRILYDAATRHQILLFSCHPERWEDLGAAARDVRALLVSQPPADRRRDTEFASAMEIDAK